MIARSEGFCLFYFLIPLRRKPPSCKDWVGLGSARSLSRSRRGWGGTGLTSPVHVGWRGLYSFGQVVPGLWASRGREGGEQAAGQPGGSRESSSRREGAGPRPRLCAADSPTGWWTVRRSGGQASLPVLQPLLLPVSLFCPPAGWLHAHQRGQAWRGQRSHVFSYRKT